MTFARTAILSASVIGLFGAGAVDLSAQQTVDWKAVDAAMGRVSVAQPGDVHRFNFPRTDMRVTAAGVAIKPAFALGGWVAMKAAQGGVMAMGDLVLGENEVNPVIAKLQAGGIEQTAIHHHLMRESPRVYYVHVHGHGDPVQLATTLRSAIAVTKIPAPAPPPRASGPLGIDTVQIAQILGTAGRTNGAVYQVSVPRAETIRDGDFEVPPSMGLGTAINFQPTGGGKAAITGDFVMLGSEVNAVIKALGAGGIEVTSLHNHLLMEEPRLFFMHFWANDDALKLARTLRSALDKTNSKRPAP
ncbi:MAG TPA: DUF1259 domain-containing protein [Gemmatimonadaceae bacterium]|nr:DUF1259 domain-containing protein [Gemmatimonadaceae bacterium]